MAMAADNALATELVAEPGFGSRFVSGMELSAIYAVPEPVLSYSHSSTSQRQLSASLIVPRGELPQPLARCRDDRCGYAPVYRTDVPTH